MVVSWPLPSSAGILKFTTSQLSSKMKTILICCLSPVALASWELQVEWARSHVSYASLAAVDLLLTTRSIFL